MNINNWIWSVYARSYDLLLHTPLYRDLLDEVIKSLNLETAKTFLNVGCGTGNLENEINSRVFKSLKQLNAIDYSLGMLSIAQKKVHNVQFEKADLNQPLVYQDNSFDRIAMINVLYALSKPEFALEEMHRVLKPKGILVIANPCKGSSLVKVIKANLMQIQLLKIPLFCLRMSWIVFLNLIIAGAAKSGYYHFWGKQEWEKMLAKKGFLGQSITRTYADQDYLIVAERG